MFWQEFWIGFAWRLPLWIVLVAFGEQLIHRYLLHGRWIHDHVPPLRYIYRGHHQEHHGKGVNRWHHINLSPIDYWLPAIAFAVGAWRFFSFGSPGGLSAMVVIVPVCLMHMILWNKMHAAFHETQHNWTERLPWFERLKQHHLDHHRHVKRNYGIVFPVTDRILGSKAEEALK